MNNAANQLKAALATNDDSALVDLNDNAVNTVREYCADKGYDANEFYTQEVTRIVRGGMSLNTYMKCSRAGSKFRATRSIRRQVWTAAKTRKTFAANR